MVFHLLGSGGGESLNRTKMAHVDPCIGEGQGVVRNAAGPYTTSDEEAFLLRRGRSSRGRRKKPRGGRGGRSPRRGKEGEEGEAAPAEGEEGEEGEAATERGGEAAPRRRGGS